MKAAIEKTPVGDNLTLVLCTQTANPRQNRLALIKGFNINIRYELTCPNICFLGFGDAGITRKCNLSLEYGLALKTEALFAGKLTCVRWCSNVKIRTF